jgi:hypothetical protein
MRIHLIWFGFFLLTSSALADSVKFAGGNTIDCTILKESDDCVIVLFGSGVTKIRRSELSEVHKDTSTANDSNVEGGNRLPDFRAVVVKLAQQKWAGDFQQIPATVIDKGVMRNVPYKSFRAGKAYEVNVYGDPQAPSGFEIGVRGNLLTDDKAKTNCIDFVTSLLGDSADKESVRALQLEKGLVNRKELTFEITPVEAEDAYGGWWVSVYNEPSLNSMRATETELKAITVSKASIAQIDKTSPSTPLESIDQWTPNDLLYSRPSYSSSKGSSSGTVYVRGYTRKDGTYVAPHTRSAPHRK